MYYCCVCCHIRSIFCMLGLESSCHPTSIRMCAMFCDTSMVFLYFPSLPVPPLFCQQQPYWMAPELLRRESGNTAASDVYSFGIVLYEVFSRENPYEGEDFEEVIRDVCDPSINKRPPVPSSMPAEVASLLYSTTLLRDPAARPTFQELDGFLKRFQAKNVDPGQQRASMRQSNSSKGANENAARLLDEIFPPHVAAALSEGAKVEPEHFDCVTIFFSDIVGFTTLSSQMTPMKVSNMLDRLYNKFDDLSHKRGVHKLETIGDGMYRYMY